MDFAFENSQFLRFSYQWQSYAILENTYVRGDEF